MTWSGATLNPCKRCGADNWLARADQDHDHGTCEVFECGGCGKKIHVELPD